MKTKTRAGSWIGGVLKLKCPRCRIGRLFPTGTFSFSRPFDMYDHCPECGLNYWPEPGFYYGAMFLSYIVFSFPTLALGAVFVWLFDMSLMSAMLLLSLVAALVFVYVFRVSRALWLSMNAKYDPALSDKILAEEVNADQASV